LLGALLILSGACAARADEIHVAASDLSELSLEQLNDLQVTSVSRRAERLLRQQRGERLARDLCAATRHGGATGRQRPGECRLGDSLEQRRQVEPANPPAVSWNSAARDAQG